VCRCGITAIINFMLALLLFMTNKGGGITTIHSSHRN
jgi:hypothetical protein